MTRVNLVLLLIAVVCALSTVNANHRARTLYSALDVEQKRTRARRAIETLATTTDLMRLDRWFAQHMLGVTLG